MRSPDGSEKELSGGELNTTNNRMEMMAVIQALTALKRPCAVTLHLDSQYVLKGITEWLAGWKAKGWRGAGGKPVSNKELWQSLEMAVARHLTVTWTWVRGHAGHELNECVDVIAAAQAGLAHE